MTADDRGIGRRGGALLAGLGAVGLAAASALLVERAAMQRDPDHIPSCSINPILSCGSVMESDQASLFGFPNAYLGVVGFSVVVVMGLLGLLGRSVPRVVWLGFGAGCAAGLAFVHWLVFQSLYRIGALCPYCMVVWVVTVVIFCRTMSHVLGAEVEISSPRARRFVAWAVDFWVLAATVWLVGVAALIAERFWDYWQQVLT